MNKTAQELIDAWGCQKFSLPEGTRIKLEAELGNDGCCPTCDSPFGYVAVYAVTGSGRTEKCREIAELRDVAIHDVILEVLATVKP